MEPTEQVKEEAAEDPQAWAMDFTGTDGARLVESAKQMDAEDPTPQQADRAAEGGTEPRGRAAPQGPQRMEMGEDLLQTTVENGGKMLFAGMSWATGQDMTLEPGESRELTRYATPVVKHRLPQGKQYLPDTLLAFYLVNLMYRKFDVQEVL